MIPLKNKATFQSALVLFFGLLLAFYLQVGLSPASSRWFFLLLPVFGFFINYTGIAFHTRKTSTASIQSLLTVLFGIKFFSYLLISVVYFIIEKEKSQRILFTGFLFLLYIAFTLVILSNLLKQQKSS